MDAFLMIQVMMLMYFLFLLFPPLLSLCLFQLICFQIFVTGKIHFQIINFCSSLSLEFQVDVNVNQLKQIINEKQDLITEKNYNENEGKKRRKRGRERERQKEKKNCFNCVFFSIHFFSSPALFSLTISFR